MPKYVNAVLVGALWIAASVDPSEASYDFRPWQVAYTVMAGLMVVGILTTLIIREPEKKISPVTTEREAHTRERFAAAGLSGWLLTATACSDNSILLDSMRARSKTGSFPTYVCRKSALYLFLIAFKSSVVG